MFQNHHNKYAEKWTAEAVLDWLDKIEKDVLEEGLPYLGASFVNLRIGRQSWAYWKRKFAAHEQIAEHIDIIEGICEKKLFEAAIDGLIPPAVAIFALKHNHHWSDRPQIALVEAPERLPMLIELNGGETVSIA
jgi:hypothetical protein